MFSLVKTESPKRQAQAESGRPWRILFVAEAVTLCHVARPLVLAKALDPRQYEIHFACAASHQRLLEGLPFKYWPLGSIPGQQFLDALAHGRPMWSVDTLRRYVKEDFKLLDAVRPDVVVGDMRLSLAVSARLKGLPYLAIGNAHFSPYAKVHFPIPEVPHTRILGCKLAGALFALARPFIFAAHALPLNRVLREYGLPRAGFNPGAAYMCADHVLYADAPGLVPIANLPETHHFLGPILWSFPSPLPAWWAEVPADRPVIYVSQGSSGNGVVLAHTLQALRDLPVTMLASTCGRRIQNVPANAFVADYLPGNEVSARADLIVTHGGTGPIHAALAAGRPVLGIPSNIDQHLSMQPVEKLGAGISIRAEMATPERIRTAVLEMLRNPAYAAAASEVGRLFARHDAGRNFRALLERLGFGPAARPSFHRRQFVGAKPPAVPMFYS